MTAIVNALAPWRLLIKGMGGSDSCGNHGVPAKKQLTINGTTRLWVKDTDGTIHEWTHITAAAGGPYSVVSEVIAANPAHEELTGGSFWKLLTGPDAGKYISFWSNELTDSNTGLGWGDISVADASGGSFSRGPGATLAILGPGDIAVSPGHGSNAAPHLLGASINYNAAGEMHFTLLNDSPFIHIPLPKLTHYSIEFYDGGQWAAPRDGFEGLIWDYDATDTEAVFYGVDYLGLLSYIYDERYNPNGSGPDKKAPVPFVPGGGSKYINATITQAITAQLNYSISNPDQPTSFITVGHIGSMKARVTLYSTLMDSLSFCLGLINSHRAGTGIMTRLYVWRNAPGDYQFQVDVNPGVARDDLHLKYNVTANLMTGYRVIPYGVNWASRANVIGRSKLGLRVYYKTDASAVDQAKYGRISSPPVYIDNLDDKDSYNDLVRRAHQMAVDGSRLGRQISAGLKLGSFKPDQGYLICDKIPVEIINGAVDTSEMGNGDFGGSLTSGLSAAYWRITGLTWETYDDGHWMTNIGLFPTGEGTTALVDNQVSTSEISNIPMNIPLGADRRVNDIMVAVVTSIGDCAPTLSDALVETLPSAWTLAGTVTGYDAGQTGDGGGLGWPGHAIAQRVYWKVIPPEGTYTFLTVTPHFTTSPDYPRNMIEVDMLRLRGVTGPPVVVTDTGTVLAGADVTIGPVTHAAGGLLVGTLATATQVSNVQSMDSFDVTDEDVVVSKAIGQENEAHGAGVASHGRWIGTKQGFGDLSITGTMTPGDGQNLWGYGTIALVWDAQSNDSIPIVTVIPRTPFAIGTGDPSITDPTNTQNVATYMDRTTGQMYSWSDDTETWTPVGDPGPTIGGSGTWGEVPSGTVGGGNDTFVLASVPTGLMLFKNGMIQYEGSGHDFVLTDDTIVFEAGNIPMTGDVLLASYSLPSGSPPPALGGIVPNSLYCEMNSDSTDGSSGVPVLIDWDTFYDEAVDTIAGGALTAKLAAMGLTYSAGQFLATEPGLWYVALSFSPYAASGGQTSHTGISTGGYSVGGDVNWGTGETELNPPQNRNQHIEATFYMTIGGGFSARTYRDGTLTGHVLDYASMDIIRLA